MAEAALRLARALLREALPRGRADAVAADLELLSRLLAPGSDVRRFLSHPLVPLADKERLLLPAAAEPVVRDLLRSLIASRETALLPAVSAAYATLLKRRRGVADALVESAAPLTAEETALVSAALSRALGKPAAVRVATNPELLAGIRVVVDGKVMDSSLRFRLAAIRERLLTS
jgi:F-type H+-transporting ATPase subunit delta